MRAPTASTTTTATKRRSTKLTAAQRQSKKAGDGGKKRKATTSSGRVAAAPRRGTRRAAPPGRGTPRTAAAGKKTSAARATARTPKPAGPVEAVRTFDGEQYDCQLVLPLRAALAPRVVQRGGRAPCFLMAPIVMRQLLQKAAPKRFKAGTRDVGAAIQASGKANAEFAAVDATGSIGHGSPLQACRMLVMRRIRILHLEARFDEFDIVDEHKEALEVSARLPTMLPYVPPPPGKEKVEVWPPAMYAAAMHRTLMTPKAERAWHSLAVIGVATHKPSRQRYFVARQTWPGCELTLVPALTRREIEALWAAESLATPEAVLSEFYRHHVLLVTGDSAFVEKGVRMRQPVVTAGPAVYSRAAHDLNWLQLRRLWEMLS